MGAWAILLLSLAPPMTHAWLRGKASNSLIEVCTTLGAKWVDAAADGDAQTPAPSPSPTHQLFEHCPCCSLHLTDLGLPPTPSPVPALVQPGLDLPELFAASPRPLFAWAAAQARAPPRSS